MGQDARSLACALERADYVQKISIVSILGRRHPKGLESLKAVAQRIKAGAPALIGKRRIGDLIIEGFQGVAIGELGIGQGVALLNECGGIIVQDHIHLGQTSSACILFLPVERNRRCGFISNLEQQ